ncbi:MAG: ClbS/DfsB family four-helix bundle protein [Candidatus Thorarchaeota archaeon]
MNKQMLMEQLDLTYSWIERMISKMSDIDISESIVHKDRSVKDILAHITAWNWNGIKWIESIAKDEKPILPMEGHSIEERPQVFDSLNEEIHKESLKKSVKEVLNEHSESWRALMTTVEGLAEEDLNRTFRFEWIPDSIQGWQVVTWRVKHAENHGKQIEAWLAQRSESN